MRARWSKSRTAVDAVRAGPADPTAVRPGNRATEALLTDPPSARVLAGHLPAAAGNRAVAGLVQAKLAVGQADDPFEREADRMSTGGADAVRLTAGSAPAGLAAAPSIVADGIGTGGHPLDPGLRATMEGRFDRDFSDVRIHPDSPAPAEIGAVAYTAGTDIVFAASAYEPTSTRGQRLLAHELTHVVQQTGGAPRVQRDGPGQAPALTQEQLRVIAYQATVLHKIPPMPEADQRALATVMADMPVYQKLVQRDELRVKLADMQGFLADLEGRNAALARGEELAGGVGASEQQMVEMTGAADELARQIEVLTTQIEPELAALGTDETHLRQHVEDEFPAIWKHRAVEIVGTMLDENEAAAKAEQARYAAQVCSPDTEGLIRADALLKPKAAEIAALQQQRQQATDATWMVAEWGAVDIGSDADRAAIEAQSARIAELQQQLQAARDQQGAAYPILLSTDYTPGMLQNLPEDQLQQLTGGWTADVLQHIEDTRKNVADGTLKVWDLRDVPALTWRALGLAPDGPLGQVVDRQHQRERSEESTLQIALAALAITAGIVATVATAGGAALVAAAAAGAGAGLGLVQLGQDIDRYRAESAAGGVAIDPALAHISVNDPELLPIIMDLVATGMDIAGAAAFVKAMSPAERALAAEGRLVTISPVTRNLALSQPELLAEYERVANSKMSALVADVLSKQRSTPSRVRLGQLRQQFDQLRQAVGDAPLTAVQRQQANNILREARDLARTDFNNVRDALWRRMRTDPELLPIEQQLQQAGDATTGGRALRVNTQTTGGPISEPLGIEHRTRLSDNPWMYNDPANLIVTDAAQNEQFMEALRQQGFVWPTNDIEDFVVRHGLNDQGLNFAPDARP